MARRSRPADPSGKSSKEETPKVKFSRESVREALHLLTYLKPYRGRFIGGLIFIALSAGSTLLFPFFLGKMIDAVAPGGSAVPSVGTGIGGALGFDGSGFRWSLNTTLLLLFAQLALQTVFSFMRVYLLTEAGERSLADMRRDVYTRLLTMPMAFFSEKRVGELSSRISSDLSQIQDAISFTLAEFLRGIFTLIIGLGFIFWISTRLALVMLAVVPVIAVLAVVFGGKIRKMARRAQDQLAESGTIVQETFSGISIVKAFTGEAYEIRRYTKSIFGVVQTAVTNARYRGAFISFMIFSVFGAIAFVMWYGARMIQAGDLTMGTLTMFVLFSVFVGGTFAGFADLFSQMQKTLGATQHVREILRGAGEPVTLTDTPDDPQFSLQGNIRLEGVEFAYPGRPDVPVLKGLDLEVVNGEQVAIVGPSGAGKSTIVSLLLRFYQPSGGVILFDGKPAGTFPLTQLRRQMAYVPQDIVLFGGTIRENIAYGRPGATDEEILQAARRANAHQFIERFPEGYETIVGERGIKLSGGQRQRIAIARAILKNPVVLILDEATSSLDSESEQLVQEALENLMRGRTSLVIAHRLSTIQNADKIVVLDEGTVAESGTHATLLGREGLYKRLVELQFRQGETEEEVRLG
ncbi:MAG TPA: ABC transporter transmembrane domain-containing protein [Chitinophagaceae bacterium]|jgi:ABC-type multidrug transport system fused ATPase/permease subunit|nr:ABC transporter transmembrane domain-containing protein [Chitinophagaceae bacterium]